VSAQPNPPRPPDPVLSRWQEFLVRNRGILVGMLTYCAIPPVLQFLFAVGPPWPQRTAVTAFTSIVGYAVAVLVFATHEYGATTPTRIRTVRRGLVLWATLAASLMMVYLLLSAFFLYDAPTAPHQVAGGFLLRPETRTYLDTHPGSTAADALRDQEFIAERVWVPWTVSLMNLAFLVSWLGFFAALAAFIGLFVVYLRMLNVLQPYPARTP
jgi:hypothetical protein